MFGDSNRGNKSFYGFSDVESALSSAKEEGLGPQENFDANGRGCQKDPAFGAYHFDSWLNDFTEETGVKADLGDSPSELEILSKVFSDKVFSWLIKQDSNDILEWLSESEEMQTAIYNLCGKSR